MLTNFIKDLAKQYTTYQPTAPDAGFIEADIRDLYKNCNLADVFPYLDDLDEATYEMETMLINDLRSYIADLLTN